MFVSATGRRTMLGQLADMLIFRITLVPVLLVMAGSIAFHRPWIDALIFARALAVALTQAIGCVAGESEPLTVLQAIS